jgi:hypothetical protein
MAERRVFTWRRVLLGVGALALASVLFIGYAIFHLVQVVIPHSYAAWETGDLMVTYLETHHGRWPRGWEDLREANAILAQRGRPIYCAFDQLPGIVKIDWSVDSEALARLAASNGNYRLKVVTQTNGSRLEANWGKDTEPNARIQRYLVARYETSNPQGGANGRQPFHPETNRTSPAAASRRSP